MENRIKNHVARNGHNKLLHYFDVYESILSEFYEKPIRLLEIGVFKGQSMKMWKECFPLSEIVGFDINPECKIYEEDGINIVIGDQCDKGLLQSLGNFDVIVDDGNHGPNEQLISFESLYPFLNDRGWYVIEDCQLGYATNLIEGKMLLSRQGKMKFSLTTQFLFRDFMDCAIYPRASCKYTISELRVVDNMIAIRKGTVISE